MSTVTASPLWYAHGVLPHGEDGVGAVVAGPGHGLVLVVQRVGEAAHAVTQRVRLGTAPHRAHTAAEKGCQDAADTEETESGRLEWLRWHLP